MELFNRQQNKNKKKSVWKEQMNHGLVTPANIWITHLECMCVTPPPTHTHTHTSGAFTKVSDLSQTGIQFLSNMWLFLIKPCSWSRERNLPRVFFSSTMSDFRPREYKKKPSPLLCAHSSDRNWQCWDPWCFNSGDDNPAKRLVSSNLLVFYHKCQG